MRTIVGPDDLIGNIEVGRTPQNRSFLQHHRVTALLTDVADDNPEVVQNLAGHFIVLALQVVARIFEVAVEALGLRPAGAATWNRATGSCSEIRLWRACPRRTRSALAAHRRRPALPARGRAPLRPGRPAGERRWITIASSRFESSVTIRALGQADSQGSRISDPTLKRVLGIRR